MATRAISISSSEWTRITDAGQSGTCWKKTQGDIFVDHTNQETADTLPLSSTSVEIEKSKKVPLDRSGGNVLSIPSDNIPSRVYYAIAQRSDVETNNLVVDVL